MIAWSLFNLQNFWFLEIFQKPPGRLYIAAKRLIHYCVFLGSCEEPPGGEALYRQATQACNPFLGFSDELPGGDEFSPGGASLFCSILWLYAVWDDSDRGKIKG